MAKAPGRQRGVKSMDMALRLLRIVQDAGAPMMLRDLADLAGITSAQAHTYMTSLKRLGLIEQDSVAGRYGLSDATLGLAKSAVRADDLLRRTIDCARDLSQRLGMMATVDRLVAERPTTIFVAAGPRPMNLNLRTGTHCDMTNSASARLFDAWQRQPRMGAGPARVIRRNRFVHAPGTPVPHLVSLAVPVLVDDRICATLSVIGFPEALPASPDIPALSTLIETTRSLETHPA